MSPVFFFAATTHFKFTRAATGLVLVSENIECVGFALKFIQFEDQNSITFNTLYPHGFSYFYYQPLLFTDHLSTLLSSNTPFIFHSNSPIFHLNLWERPTLLLTHLCVGFCFPRKENGKCAKEPRYLALAVVWLKNNPKKIIQYSSNSSKRV